MANKTRAWEKLLRTPFPCDHIIQLYSKDAALVAAVARFVAGGLERDEAVVVIAIPEHITALTKRLTTSGRRVANALDEGAFIALDAERCLAKFMINGIPDRAMFRSEVTGVLDRLRQSGYDKIRLFGEMVNLLWRHDAMVTIRLEELWNEVIVDYQVCLLCAYRVDTLETESRRGILHKITRSHSHSLSLEDEYELL